MNIYDEVLRLPRSHRLALAGWILRSNPVPDRRWGRLMGISRQAVAKRESKTDSEYTKVTL